MSEVRCADNAGSVIVTAFRWFSLSADAIFPGNILGWGPTKELLKVWKPQTHEFLVRWCYMAPFCSAFRESSCLSECETNTWFSESGAIRAVGNLLPSPVLRVLCDERKEGRSLLVEDLAQFGSSCEQEIFAQWFTLTLVRILLLPCHHTHVGFRVYITVTYVWVFFVRVSDAHDAIVPDCVRLVWLFGKYSRFRALLFGKSGFHNKARNPFSDFDVQKSSFKTVFFEQWEIEIRISQSIRAPARMVFYGRIDVWLWVD